MASRTAAVRRLVLGELEAVNRQDPDGLAGHFSEDCEFVDLSDGTVIEGKEAFLADLLGVFSAVPDLHVVEKRLVAEDGVAAAEILPRRNPRQRVARPPSDRGRVPLAHLLRL